MKLDSFKNDDQLASPGGPQIFAAISWIEFRVDRHEWFADASRTIRHP